MNGTHHHIENGHVNGHLDHDIEVIESKVVERYTLFSDDTKTFKNLTKEHKIETVKHVPKLGVMLVGLGGNNGSTFVAGILANKKNLTWETK